MPSTFTPNLRLTLQADGENPSTWGDIANTVFQLVEQAVASSTSIVLSTGTTTLTTANGASDQARSAILLLTGALTGACTLVIPNLPKMYIIFNNTTNAFTVTVQTAAPSATLVVPQGTSALIYCDGNNNVFSPAGNATTLGGVAAGNFAQLTANFNNLFQSQQSLKENTVAYNASIALNLGSGNSFQTTLTGGTTLGTPTGTTASYDQLFYYQLTQDASGSRSVGFNSSWVFPSGVVPQVDQSANATTVLTCLWSANLSKVIVLAVGVGYSGGATVGNLTFSTNEVGPISVFKRVGSPAGAVNVTVTVNAGVRLIAASASTVALDFTGFASGSVITLINNGYILGRGGNGGNGGAQGHGGSTTTSQNQGSRGRAGGAAIQDAPVGVTLNITNNGNIWGGGGGGGGGGAANTGSGQDSNGGGGGAGAGGGIGGDGGDSGILGTDVQANNGGDGSFADSGANGSGGTGSGALAGATGGNGGDWGTAGTAGTNSNTHGGAAGAAGAATTGGNPPTFVAGGTAPNVKGAKN